VAMLRKATEIDPDRVGAWHNIAILTKISAGERSFVERLQEMLTAPRRTDYERSMLHFALGKAYDDLGEPELAIGHFDQGNALERKKLSFDRAEFATGIDRIIATFTADFFCRHAGVGTRDQLPLLILGMPRSGTTLVEQIVSAHPMVAAGGELTFWSEHQSPGSGDGLRQAGAEYLALLRRIGPEAARITDKGPFNFLALGQIRLALPQARVIHCRRDPIDTCLSIYFTRFAVPQPFAYDRGDLVFYYRQYQRLMAHWRAALSADRLIEVDYEAMTADPEAQTRRLIDFCGLPWDDACLAPERNQGLVRTASVWQARQPVYRSSVARWHRYQPWLGELRQLQIAEV
jgi:tetratricopeptide (TPR) repeat protein